MPTRVRGVSKVVEVGVGDGDGVGVGEAGGGGIEATSVDPSPPHPASIMLSESAKALGMPTRRYDIVVFLS